MIQHGLPALYAVFLWWFSTGLILHLDGLRRETFRASMAGATLLLGAALAGLWWVADDTSVPAAYLGFSFAVLAWGWIELAFLTGWVTGPRRTALPPGLAGWARARAALEAVLWHELAILGLGAAIAAICWGAANQVGLWTYLVLWVMRSSAKLNIFLGVRNLGEAFLPDHLRYLESYFARRPMNLLFPFAVIGSVLAGALILAEAAAGEPGRAVGLTLVGTMLALAIIEHMFMVLPIPAEALWRWGLRSREPALAAAAKPKPLS